MLLFEKKIEFSKTKYVHVIFSVFMKLHTYYVFLFRLKFNNYWNTFF